MRRIALSLLSIALLFTACEKNNYMTSHPAAAVFSKMFPSARNVEWEYEAGMLKAEFREGSYEKEAWFDNNASWLMTKTDIPVRKAPQNILDAALNHLGQGWYVEDVDHYLSSGTPSEYYIVECERRGWDQEVKLMITPTGEVITKNKETGF